MKDVTRDLQKNIEEQKNDYELKILNVEKKMKISQFCGKVEKYFDTLAGQDGSIGASNFIIEQLIKDKNEIERKYDEIFSLYSSLLDHNKVLMTRFNQFIREKDMSSSLGRANDNLNPSNKKEKKRRNFSKYRQHETDKESLLAHSRTNFGRIRKKNKERNISESIISHSYDEDKLKKSQMASIDISNFTIIKTKNHQMNIDELKSVSIIYTHIYMIFDD